MQSGTELSSWSYVSGKACKIVKVRLVVARRVVGQVTAASPTATTMVTMVVMVAKSGGCEVR